MNDKVKNVLEWIACILIAIVLALLIKFFIATPTVVKSVSMKPTLIEGQRLILDRTQRTFNKELKRGDIVTFEEPSTLQVSIDEADLEKPLAKYEYKPEGLINSFQYYVLENTKKSFIKRVIGLPGEHVKIENGKVYINGEELDEPYLKEGVITESLGGAFTDFTVPEGTVFLMGDNRPNSMDCREFGCIPLDKIESKVWIRVWPLNLFGKID